MAWRSVKLTLNNETDQPLHQLGAHLDHGVWVKEPPATISPNSAATWESESHGFLTGTAGWVQYRVESMPGSAELHWKNPFVGRSDFPHEPPPGYETTSTVGRGSNAMVIFTLKKK
jgi:hypothetical protein